MVKTCSLCGYYRHGEFLDGIRLTGYCKRLNEQLQQLNTSLYLKEEIEVASSFGCILWNDKVGVNKELYITNRINELKSMFEKRMHGKIESCFVDIVDAMQKVGE